MYLSVAATRHFDRVGPAGQRVYPTSDTDDDDDAEISAGGVQSGSTANFNQRFQYKTPNLSDRLKSEQLQEEKAKVHYVIAFTGTLFIGCVLHLKK